MLSPTIWPDSENATGGVAWERRGQLEGVAKTECGYRKAWSSGGMANEAWPRAWLHGRRA